MRTILTGATAEGDPRRHLEVPGRSARELTPHGKAIQRCQIPSRRVNRGAG
jgi:hypothetical protein